MIFCDTVSSGASLSARPKEKKYQVYLSASFLLVLQRHAVGGEGCATVGRRLFLGSTENLGCFASSHDWHNADGAIPLA